jgi:hypothetical protein
VNGAAFSGMIDELMIWNRIVPINQLFQVLDNPSLLLQCTTQTPTPTQTKTPSQTPTQTRTPSPSILPEIRPGTIRRPTSCSAADQLVGCPGATVDVIISKYGVQSGANATNGQIYVIPLGQYIPGNSDIRTMPGSTALGGVNSPTATFVAGNGTFKLKTSNWYVFQLVNNFGQLSNFIFVEIKAYTGQI